MAQGQGAWSDEDGAGRVLSLFSKGFGGSSHGVWASPGRVNLIGDHVDYNRGLCLPVALPHRTFVAVSRRQDGRVRLATDMDAKVLRWEGVLDEIAPGRVDGWAAYAAGPAWALRQAGLDVPGFDMAITSSVPVGAGLSSSAAVECAAALGLSAVADQPLGDDDAGRARLARLCVRAENEVAGAPTGGLDQAASLRARAGHALLLDCRDNSASQVELPLERLGLELVVIDTRASHSLSDGQYGQRRADCEAAAKLLGVESLREFADRTDWSALDGELAALPGRLRPRARHVVTEIWRVTGFVDAVRRRDVERAGRLMVESHASLRDDFEVSVAELDCAVEASLAAGAVGARMTGGGFGGSVVALVPRDAVASVARSVVAEAERCRLPEPEVHRASAGEPGRRVL